MEKPIDEISLLLDIFPYSLVLDHLLNIDRIGASLLKISQDIRGDQLQDHFKFQRPYIELLSFDTLAALSSEACYIRHDPSELLLRGQFRIYNSKMIFLASLWVMDIEQLKPYRIAISDFPTYDPTFDYLHALKQSDIHKNELSDLLKKIDAQSIEIRRSNEELNETKIQIESIFNEMTEVVWSMKLPEMKVLFITPFVKQLYEIDIQECSNDPNWWSTIIHPDDTNVISAINTDLNLHGTYNQKYRIVTRSGRIKWVESRGKYIYSADSEVIRLDSIIVDRTAEYIAQETLDQELKLQEALIDIASTYINLDPKDVENSINTSLKKMGLFVAADRAYIFDYDFNGGTTSNTYEWCNEGINAEIDNLQYVPITHIPQWLEQHHKGEAFYVPSVAKLEDDGEGGLKSILAPQGIKSLITIPMLDGDELVGFVGFDSVKQHHLYSEKEKKLLFLFGQMLINIRNRQKWENQLRLQEEKYRNIIANMNLGLLEVDLEDVIIYANQSFCEMSGYSLQELKGRIAADLFVDERDRMTIYEKNHKRVQSISDSYEIEVKDKQGSPHWWFISGAPNYNDKGQLIGSIGIHLDITEQKRLEKELEKAITFAEAAAKAKELFLANMSHEIRTPLNVIIGMIRMLSKENLSTDQHFYIKQSESSAKHLLTILNNVLDIAKIESGDMELVQNAFSLSALAYNVHSIMYSQAKDKNLEFGLKVSPDLMRMHIGDETRLRQVLINLLGNAIKFTEEGSIVLSIDLLEHYEDAQKVRFQITDTGIGMAPEFISKIFDKFSQEQSTTNRKYEGTGLGMAISKDLIKLMGGDMKVDSVKHQGTTCSFELSLPKGQGDIDVNKNEHIKEGAYLGKKALLVEDNEMNRFIAIQSLNYLGFETIEAENGLKATELIRQSNFDIILMDIQMPVMDGVEATSYIREILNNHTPIIALTANAFKHDIELYLKKGMNDFITKPYDEEDFFRKIKHILSHKQVASSEGNGSQRASENAPALSPLYDLAQLRELSRGNEEFVKKMVSIFIELMIESTNTMESAFQKNDFQAIQKISHKIKPSIDQMGIVRLKDTIRKLEKFDPVSGSKSEFEVGLHTVVHTLRKVVKELSNLKL